jgi:DNA-binding NarL/FixJ family response regulator
MGRYQVLIADDNARARRGLRALLALRPEIELIGEAADGQEAVQMVRECQPDALLMDVRMPQMDGLEATRQIKQHWPEVRVVVVSMYTSYRVAALASGADSFLRKGCTVEEVLAAILGTRA